MVRSMTGFGQGSADAGELQVSVVVRSVNNRYADVKLRLPEFLASWESEAKRRVAGRVRRGRVDVDLRVRRGGRDTVGPSIDRAAAAMIVAEADALARSLQIANGVDVATLLAVPGIVAAADVPDTIDDATRAAVESALDRALDVLDAERLREGRALRADLVPRLASMEATVAEIEAKAHEVPAALRRKLVERVDVLAQGIPIDPQRLAQEAAFLADRADVSEEIVRLRAHLAQARRLLEDPDGEPVGRRLDFLVQEVLRETNTIASKSSDLDISRGAVDLKVETERVREQVQNLE